MGVRGRDRAEVIASVLKQCNVPVPQLCFRFVSLAAVQSQI